MESVLDLDRQLDFLKINYAKIENKLVRIWEA